MLRRANNELSDKLRELWMKFREYLPTLYHYEHEMLDIKAQYSADIHIPDFNTVAETEKVFTKYTNVTNLYLFVFSSLFSSFLYSIVRRFYYLKNLQFQFENAKLEHRHEMNTLQSNVDYLTNKIEITGYDKLSNESNLNYEQDNISKKGTFIQWIRSNIEFWRKNYSFCVFYYSFIKLQKRRKIGLN